MLIVNVADDFLENVLKCDDALQITIFIDNHGKMFTPGAKCLQLIKQQGCLGNK